MKNVLFLIVIMLWACNGGDRNLAPGATTPSADGHTNPNNSLDGKFYTGFYELTDGEKREQERLDWNFHNGYFDRHTTMLDRGGQFIYDVLHFKDKVDEVTGEVSIVQSVKLRDVVTVELDKGESDVFLRKDKSNYVKVFLVWNPSFPPEILAEHKFFACDPENLGRISGSFFGEDPFELNFDNDEQWEKGEYAMIFKVDRPGKIGICRQYKNYEAILYDVLNIKEYPGSEYNVTLVNVGDELNLKANEIETEKDYFFRAGVDIKYKSVKLNVPEDFRESIRDYPTNSRGNKYISNRNKYLFVRGVYKEEEANHECYENIWDDITLINDRIVQEMAGGNYDDRTAVIYNNNHVLFWTFRNVNNDIVEPCYSELTLDTSPEDEKEYKVAILNTDTYCDRYNCVYDDDGFSIDYERMYLKRDRSGDWKAYSYSSVFGPEKFKTLFDPKCHVLIDTDRYQNRKDRNNRPKYDLRSVIPDGALGVTEEYIGIGLMSLSSPAATKRTFMHELGHLLGLSDVEDDANLMNWTDLDENKNVNKHLLNGRPLRAKACAKCNWKEKSELQWECLNEMDIQSTCHNAKHRKFN